jgi:ribosome-associated toxin RatA of RatAB toxin-antitoxin module
MPVAAGDVSGCRVELDLTFEPLGGLAAMALAPVVERLASSLVDAFVARARQERAARPAGVGV